MNYKPQSYFLRIKELEREIYRERQMKEIAYITIAELEAKNAELLEALKELIKWADHDPNCIDNCPVCRAYLQAQQAIDKVEGKE